MRWTTLDDCNVYEKHSDWDAWIKLQQSDFCINEVLEAYPKFMHKAVVLALTVAKWHKRNSKQGYGICASYKFNNDSCDNCFHNKICGPNSLKYKNFIYFTSKNIPGVFGSAMEIYFALRRKYDKELKFVNNIEQFKNNIWRKSFFNVVALTEEYDRRSN